MVERESTIRTLIDHYAEIYPDNVIEIGGDASVLDKEPFLAPVFTELARNSIEQGASQVTVTFGEGRITFEDNLVHNEPGDILANLNSERPKTSKSGLGGVGIWSSRDFLRKLGGSLTYHQTENGGIVAEALFGERIEKRN